MAIKLKLLSRHTINKYTPTEALSATTGLKEVTLGSPTLYPCLVQPDFQGNVQKDLEDFTHGKDFRVIYSHIPLKYLDEIRGIEPDIVEFNPDDYTLHGTLVKYTVKNSQVWKGYGVNSFVSVVVREDIDQY